MSQIKQSIVMGVTTELKRNETNEKHVASFMVEIDKTEHWKKIDQAILKIISILEEIKKINR